MASSVTLAVDTAPIVPPVALLRATEKLRPPPEGVAAKVGMDTARLWTPAGMVTVCGVASKSVPAIAGVAPVPVGVTVTVTGLADTVLSWMLKVAVCPGVTVDGPLMESSDGTAASIVLA